MSTFALPSVRRTLRVAGLASGEDFIPMSAWMPATGITALNAVIRKSDKFAAVTFKAAYQTAATIPSSPDAHASWGTGVSESGSSECAGLTTVDMDGKYWIRFGVGVSGGSTTRLTSTDVEAHFSGRD